MKTLSQVQGCFLGVAIGDAMGMPWEGKTPAEIQAEVGEIKGFVDCKNRKVKDTAGLELGSTTDDWQLTEAVARSLIRCKSFNVTDMALSHVEAIETSTSGFGRTTLNSLKEIKEYFDTRGKSGRSPEEAATKGGCGNGIAMKVAPLGLFPYLGPDQIEKLGKLTHPDPRAWDAAWVIAQIINYPMWATTCDISNWGGYYSRYYTDEMFKDNFQGRLKKLENQELLFGPIEILREEIGTGCFALESVCFAIAIFLRNPDDFRKGMLEAMNAGGDTDTTSSIVGALIGSNVGLEGIPEEWILPQFSKVFELSKDFYSTFNNADGKGDIL